MCRLKMCGTIYGAKATPTSSRVAGTQTALTDVLLVPQLQSDKKDLQDQLTNETQIATNNKKLYDDEVVALTGEQKAHAADKLASATEITALKADARKSKLKWFGIGVLVGYGLRVITVK